MSISERHIETVEGRGGWKVPIGSWESEWRSPESNFAGFFEEMWTVNGYDISRYDESFRTYRPVPRSYDHEVSIPAAKHQPALIMRGLYRARTSSEVEQDLDRNVRRSEWGRTESAHTGYETHTVYTLPEQAGKLLPLIELRHVHTTGGSGPVGANLSRAPVVSWLGNELSSSQVRYDSEEAGENEGFGINLKEAEGRHRLYMKQLFDETIQLLAAE